MHVKCLAQYLVRQLDLSAARFCISRQADLVARSLCHPTIRNLSDLGFPDLEKMSVHVGEKKKKKKKRKKECYM